MLLSLAWFDGACGCSQQTLAAEGSAVVSGIITDSQSAAIAGAKVRLLSADGPSREQQTNGDGRYAFTNVPAGTYSLRASAAGFGDGSLNGFVVEAGNRELPPLALQASTHDSVDAISQRQMAEIQVQEEEHQRLLGVLPNYFVTYDWNAQPLAARQKFELAWKTSIDPVSHLVNLGFAGVGQATNSMSGYGSGPASFGKRFGAIEGDFAVQTLVGGALLPTLLRQDPRYFYKGTGSVMSRALYALSTAVIARGDNGKWQPSYSGIGGDMAAAAISNLYYPVGSRHSAPLTITNGLLQAGLDGVSNLVQEFVLNHVTTGRKHSDR
ncbi:Carboxypeptidase regulatory-like domain-containing protein [Bryocella elongata]|uniref:Carboxypeptidase regulatory-like domain-containing protein n=2 Tax=Bryocella elongata TaxID=863522 RepID=A0A1H6A3Y5_9BACT|nr:Carboxypeptidase regulatory-like domain-containing protein [Bryocella elongata]